VIDIELLRSLLSYDPSTGKLYWKERPAHMFKGGRHFQWNARYAGQEAFINKSMYGYLKGLLFGRTYLAHRVAYALYHGHWPTLDIDHANGVKDDNRAVNLRHATRQQNAQNRGKRSTPTSSPYVGVCLTPYKTWMAQAKDQFGRMKYLGTFDNPEEAARAYDVAVCAWRGEFAKPNFDRQAA
jgi:hypothetical protein